MGSVGNAGEVGDRNEPIVIDARDNDRGGNDEPRSRQRPGDEGGATGAAAHDETDAYADAEAAEVEAVYRSLLASICVEVACSVHRSAKTGTMPYSELMVPSGRPGGGRRRKRTSSGEIIVGDDDEDDPSSSKAEDGDARDGAISTFTANSGDRAGVNPGGGDGDNQTQGSGGGGGNNSNCDVYGRVPPKEPKLPARCVLCGRTVSALRFAPHLDKCMGIGNRGGGGGANNGVGGPVGASGVGGGYGAGYGAGYGTSTRSGGAKLS